MRRRSLDAGVQGPLNNGFQTNNQNVITKTSGLEKFKLKQRLRFTNDEAMSFSFSKRISVELGFEAGSR
jgi:hypothetical protein